VWTGPISIQGVPLRSRTLLSGAAAAAVGLLGFVGQASASAFPAFGGWFHAWPKATGGPSAKSAPASPSQVLAGYGVNEQFSSINVTTTFVAPKVKCARKNSVVLAGLLSVSPSGGQAASLLIGCKQTGKAFYFTAVASGSAVQHGHGVHPGDKLVLHEKANATRVFLSVTDKANPKADLRLTTAGDSTFGPGITEVKDSNNGAPYPIPDFGKISFTNSKLNGQPFGGFPLSRIEMVNSSNVIQIATSPFKSDNESFTSTFKHS
jgi:hypothetical protein